MIDITLLHDLHYLDDFLHMFACSNETLKHEHLVIVEHVSILTAHDLKDEHNLEIKTKSLCTSYFSFFKLFNFKIFPSTSLYT